MIERLLLDRIDRNRCRTSVCELNQAPAEIFSNEAEAVLAISDVAVAGAEVTVQTAIGHLLPPTGVMKCFAHDECLSHQL